MACWPPAASCTRGATSSYSAPGVGKTHLAIALGVLTAEMGHRIYFTTAVELARRMAKAMAENRLTRKINGLVHPKLLIVDEVGHLSLEPATPACSSRLSPSATSAAGPSCSPATRP